MDSYIKSRDAYFKPIATAPLEATLRHLRSHRDTEGAPTSGVELGKLLYEPYMSPI